MEWQTPKTDWQAGDVPTRGDFNRIEGNINAIETGERTLDPAQAPASSVGSLRQLLDWFANRFKAILGTTDWFDAPPTTLAATKDHIDAAAPHSGHATTVLYTATLNTTWSGSSAPYSKVQTVTGILPTDTPIIDIVLSGTYATDIARLNAWSHVYRAVTSADIVTFYAAVKPTVELPVQIKVVR
jgi:hypothetical protein